jgi:hypothetical protein
MSNQFAAYPFSYAGATVCNNRILDLSIRFSLGILCKFVSTPMPAAPTAQSATEWMTREEVETDLISTLLVSMHYSFHIPAVSILKTC